MGWGRRGCRGVRTGVAVQNRPEDRSQPLTDSLLGAHKKVRLLPTDGQTDRHPFNLAQGKGSGPSEMRTENRAATQARTSHRCRDRHSDCMHTILLSDEQCRVGDPRPSLCGGVKGTEWGHHLGGLQLGMDVGNGRISWERRESVKYEVWGNERAGAHGGHGG